MDTRPPTARSDSLSGSARRKPPVHGRRHGEPRYIAAGIPAGAADRPRTMGGIRALSRLGTL